jgi:hypothetical protein
MVIQKPIRNRGTPGLRTGGAQTSETVLANALLKSGRAQSPAQAKLMAAQILQGLKSAGFPLGTPNNLLGDLQSWAGIPKSGVMDAATLSFLAGAGMMQKVDALQKGVLRSPDQAAASVKDSLALSMKETKDWSQFRDTRKSDVPASTLGKAAGELHKSEILDRQSRNQATVNELSNLQGQLTQLGFSASAKGNRALRAQLQSFQAANGLPETGRLDASTSAALRDQGVQAPVVGKSAPEGMIANQKSAGPRKGIPEESKKGRGKHDSEGQGEEPDPDSDADGNDLGEMRDIETAHEDDWGNSPAGEEGDPLSEEGHATLDAESDAEVGYYEVASLRTQYTESLEKIQASRVKNGPVRYSWDVTFYKPGVYGAYQPAEPLWHIGIQDVSPFAEIWAEARQALVDKFSTFRETEVPIQRDFERALRRARMRLEDQGPPPLSED